MPLSLALNSALTGLLTSQTALDVISNNLANVDNPNYSRKTVAVQELVLDGQGAGVQISGIQREVDQNLNNSLDSASGTLNQLQTMGNYYTQVQNQFGSPGDGSTLGDQLQSLYNSLETQANSPSQTPSAVIQSTQDIITSLQNTSTSVQGLRTQADQQISKDVDQVNTALTDIASLNNKIALNTATGTDVSDLEDQRDAQLSTLSGLMNFNVFQRNDGTVSLYTTQGTPLLDGGAQTLSHTASSSVTAGQSAAGGELQGVMVDGVDISSQITSGDISSLLQLRDQVLPNLQTQMDTLGQTLADGVNQLNNQGVSFPNGGQSFNGTTSFIDPSQQTISVAGGDTAVTLFNGDGSQKSTTTMSLLMKQYLQNNNLPTTGSWTVDQVADGLNGWLNTQFNTSGITYAQIDPAGQFSIQLPQTSSTSLAFRDETTNNYTSSISSTPDSTGTYPALGLTGPLTFRDDGGNVFSVNVAASDTMQSIASKLNSVVGGGITASLVASTSGAGNQLQVTDNGGYNLYVDPDAAGNTVQSGLGILPSGANPATNVSVGFNADTLGTSFTGSEYASGATVPGAAGTLTFADQTGTIAAVTVASGASLTTIANQINSAGNGKLTASIITTGNQVRLHVVDAQGNQMSVTGTAAVSGATDPVTTLGLQPPPDQTTQGFSNFFGLNDLIVNTQPVVSVQSQTLTKGFVTNQKTNLEISDASWGNGAPDGSIAATATPTSAGAPVALNISLAAGQSLTSIAAQINEDGISYDGGHTKAGGFTAQGGSLQIVSGITSLGSITVTQHSTLNGIAAQINSNTTMQNAGVQAVVATDGTNQWLRVYNQQGQPLAFSGTMIGTSGGQLNMGVTQLVNASVVTDGSGQRLQISNTESDPLQVTGSLVAMTNISANVMGAASNLQVRSDIVANPSLLSQGSVQYDPQSGQYFVAQGDNTTTLGMANYLSNSIAMPSAGGLGAGSYTLNQYATNIISSNSINANNNNTQLTYQQTLVQNLTTQKASVSGVNLDQELSNLIMYQQAYSASAKVISTMNTLFQVLDNVIQ